MGLLRKLRRFRPSPGTVIACVALVVACTGTATAATLITSQQIKNNSLTTKDVRNESLRGGDVKDGSLRARDFQAGELPRGPAGATGATGPQGAPGPQGARGPQGEPGLSGLETVYSESPFDSTSEKSVSATCPDGKRVISTGYDLAGGKTGAHPDVLTDVVVDNLGFYGSAAYVDAYEEDATAAAWPVIVSALCARVGP